MKNKEIIESTDNVSSISKTKENLVMKNNGLIKLFIICFIVLLIYLTIDKFTNSNKTLPGSVNVVGFFYGPIDKKSNDEAIISLGKLNQLKNGLNETQSIARENIKIETQPSKNELFTKLKFGTSFVETVKILGNPTKALDVTEKEKQSGFRMYLWDGQPRMMAVFYKDKLITKL